MTGSPGLNFVRRATIALSNFQATRWPSSVFMMTPLADSSTVSIVP